MGFILHVLSFGMLVKFDIDIIRLQLEKIINRILRKINRKTVNILCKKYILYITMCITSIQLTQQLLNFKPCSEHNLPLVEL